MDRQTGGGASAPIFLSADQKAPHSTATSRKKILPVYMKSRRISIENKGILKDEQAGMDILKAASSNIHKNERGEESATQWSILYNNTDLTAKMIMGRKYDQPAHEFSLK